MITKQSAVFHSFICMAIMGLSQASMAANFAPMARAGNYTIYQGDNLSLDGSASADPNDYIATYQWDLNNDAVFEATGVKPVISSSWLHTYHLDTLGTHSFSLKVTDSYGATALDAGRFVVLDSALKPVPVPAAAWLFGSGLIGFAGVARTRKTD